MNKLTLRIEQLEILDSLTNEQAGKLFKAIKNYKKPNIRDAVVKVAFEPFKAQIIADEKKAASLSITRAKVGAIGGKATLSKPKQMKANVPNSIAKANKTTVKLPYQQIADLYMEILPELPRVFSVNDTRKRTIKTAWYSDKRFRSIDFWESYLKKVSEIDFLMGRSKTWRANFDFLIKSSTIIKVIEGQYE